MADIDSKLPTETDDMPLDSVAESAVLPQQHQHTDEELLKSNDSGEEYSSGSDRSIEADNTDELRCDSHAQQRSGDGDAPVIVARVRSKRHRHGSHGSRRHKGGSRHKYRSTFQPYPDTGDLETSLKRKSLELQEKENAAALLRQEGGEDHFVTFPVAPFNSTQFLMDEHSMGNTPTSVSKPGASHSPKLFSQDPALNSVTSTPSRMESDDIVRLAEFNSRSIDKEFAEFYSSIHAENLQSMPKEELVKHYMSLEEQVAALQKKVAEAEQRTGGDSECAANNLVNDKDCATGSDTNSLSSGNEEFVDLSMNVPAEDKTKDSYMVKS